MINFDLSKIVCEISKLLTNSQVFQFLNGNRFITWTTDRLLIRVTSHDSYSDPRERLDEIKDYHPADYIQLLFLTIYFSGSQLSPQSNVTQHTITLRENGGTLNWSNDIDTKQSGVRNSISSSFFRVVLENF